VAFWAHVNGTRSARADEDDNDLGAYDARCT